MRRGLDSGIPTRIASRYSMAKRVATSGSSRNDKLHRIRVQEKGWTKQELAKHAGTSAQTVRKAERGDAVNEVMQGRIAKALGVNVEDLFGE